ncbi:MAG TPA: hypothetical protein PKW42_03420 [bacterium]|nr:hypothetical protein [bacterium]
MSHPRYQVEKEYQVTVVPPFRSQDARVFLEGIEDNGEKLVARHIEVLKQLPGKTVLKLVLTEGKKREIRRMFASQRYHVLTLKRVRIGRVSLGSLKPGQYRPLKNREIQAFMRERPKPKDKEPANR